MSDGGVGYERSTSDWADPVVAGAGSCTRDTGASCAARPEIGPGGHLARSASRTAWNPKSRDNPALHFAMSCSSSSPFVSRYSATRHLASSSMLGFWTAGALGSPGRTRISLREWTGGAADAGCVMRNTISGSVEVSWSPMGSSKVENDQARGSVLWVSNGQVIRHRPHSSRLCGPNFGVWKM